MPITPIHAIIQPNLRHPTLLSFIIATLIVNLFRLKESVVPIHTSDLLYTYPIPSLRRSWLISSQVRFYAAPIASIRICIVAISPRNINAGPDHEPRTWQLLSRLPFCSRLRLHHGRKDLDVRVQSAFKRAMDQYRGALTGGHRSPQTD